MTKLSHLHFVATDAYARRVIQLGEEPWRVTVCGAPSLDNLRIMRLLGRPELERRVGLRLEPAPLLLTFHPVTLEWERTEQHVGEVLAALEGLDRPLVCTAPNADTRGGVIRRALEAHVRRRRNAVMVKSLGTEVYFSLMATAAVMVGNSSSGLIEAPSFGLPVVNIGARQEGRVRGDNVLDVGPVREEIRQAIETALTPAFRARAQCGRNPYGDGHAAERIVDRLLKILLDARLIRKRFVDLTESAAMAGEPQREIHVF